MTGSAIAPLLDHSARDVLDPTEAARLPGARLVRINRDHPGLPASLADRAASLDGDAAKLIHQIVTTERITS